MSFRKWYMNKLKRAVGKSDSYYVLNELYDYLVSSDEDTEDKLKHAKDSLLYQINRVRWRTFLASGKSQS